MGSRDAIRWSLVVGLQAACLGLWGCGGSEPNRGSGTENETTTTTDEGEDWNALTFEQKHDWMVTEVVPTMKEFFFEFDAQAFPTFGCRNCHRRNAQALRYAMPNGLHPLSEEDFAGSSPMHEFMATRVLPTMAELLGKEIHSPTTGQGFGCFACHERGAHASP